MIEFDAAKDRRNRAKHGLPLAAAAVVFEGPTVEWHDDRDAHDEERICALGALAGRVVMCVYTWRGEVRRIISLRKATRREAHAYHGSIG